MDQFTRGDLGRLLQTQDPHCVSIYMPTHRGGRETMQDPIRLRNLLNESEDRLVESDLRYADARTLLEPARKLVQDPEFWRYQSDGLAVFISESGIHRFRVPQTFREMTIASPRFHVTPMLPLLAEEGRYFVLGLSQDKVRLLRCTRQECQTLSVPDMPGSFDELGRFIDVDESVQWHTGAPQHQGVRGERRDAVFHGQGEGTDDAQKKKWLPDYCKIIERAVSRFLNNESGPLVLAATEPLEAIYRGMNTYPQLAEQTLAGNTDHMNEAELHERSWPVAAPHLEAERAKTIDAYTKVRGTPRASNLLDVVLQAAQEGRVMALLLAVDAPVWGKYDAQSSRIELHARVEPGDEDLLNAAAVLTQTHGGNVYGLTRSQMPDDKPIAAVFRY